MLISKIWIYLSKNAPIDVKMKKLNLKGLSSGN